MRFAYLLIGCMVACVALGCRTSGGEDATLADLDRWTFPDEVAGFHRRSFERDEETRTLIAGYGRDSPAVQLTMYVYPAPGLASVASDQQTQATARRLLTEQEFQGAQRALRDANPQASLLFEDDHSILRMLGAEQDGFAAGYTFRARGAEGIVDVLTGLILFRHADWSVKYRVTFEVADTDVAAPQVITLMESIPWPDFE